METVFGVILGTGVGGGIVIGGRLVVGANAIAGEWGHNQLPWPTPEESPGPPCYCGRSGCIETFLSGPALAADHHRHTGRQLTGSEIADLAGRGDAGCGATLGRYADRLARGLAAVINLIDPDAIVLGGGVSGIAMLYQQVPVPWSSVGARAGSSSPAVTWRAATVCAGRCRCSRRGRRARMRS